MKLKTTLLVAGIMSIMLTSFVPGQLASAQSISGTADVVFVVDESGSMGTEHDFLDAGGSIPSIAVDLDNALIAEGVTNNRYALVGFGASSAHGVPGHIHTVGGGQFGTAAQFATAAGSLVLSGGTEDGYDGIDEALQNLSFRQGAAKAIIVITDEDRDDITSGAITYSTIDDDLKNAPASLNSIVNAIFTDVNNSQDVVGIRGDGTAYVADGSGGFTTSTGGSVSSAAGTTEADYVDLAHDNGGAGWDLNKLRNGGTDQDSFTAAFIDIKVQEIIEDIAVGGELLPINMTSLLIAGAMGNLMWLTPLAAGAVGATAFYLKSKRN